MLMDKILKKSGAERVSDSAKEELKVYLEEIAETVSINAVKLAGHAGRKTIKASDVTLAIKS